MRTTRLFVRRARPGLYFNRVPSLPATDDGSARPLAEDLNTGSGSSEDIAWDADTAPGTAGTGMAPEASGSDGAPSTPEAAGADGRPRTPEAEPHVTEADAEQIVTEPDAKPRADAEASGG